MINWYVCIKIHIKKNEQIKNKNEYTEKMYLYTLH